MVYSSLAILTSVEAADSQDPQGMQDTGQSQKSIRVAIGVFAQHIILKCQENQMAKRLPQGHHGEYLTC